MAGENDPVVPASPIPSIFWANAPPNSPLSYQSLQTRRKIAEALMGRRSPFPKTLGEGLTYGSERLAEAFDLRNLEQQQRAFDVEAGRDVQRAGSMLYGTPAPSTGRTTSDAGDTGAATTADASDGDTTPARFASVRYNNPGAQYPVDQANAQPFEQQGYGVIGGGNKIAQFPTPVHGAAANMDLLDRNYTGMPIGAAINKWSGGGRTGIPGFDPNAVITKEAMRDPAFAIPFAKAIAGGEAPGRYPMSEDQSAAAHNMFTGVRGGMPPPLPPARPSADLADASPDAAASDTAGTLPDATGEGRDAITEAAMAGTQFPGQNARVASLGGPLGNAGAASAVIPPTLTTPTIPPAGGPAAAAPSGNPPIVVPITPRPPAVAQAQPSMVTPQYPPPQPAENIGRPVPPPQTPMTNEEKLARLQMMQGAATGNQPKFDTWKGVVEEFAKRRAFIDAQNAEAHKSELTQWTADTAARQAASRERAKMQAEGKLPEPGPAPLSEGQYDSRLGTPKSPQRVGIPTMPPVPAGVQPEKHAEAQMPLIVKAQEAVRSAVPQFDEMIKAIDLARNHPGKDAGTGALGKVYRSIHGTEAYGFGTIVDQLKGKNFLSGYQLLRSAGPAGNISNIEGTKTEQAQARIDPNQTKKGFDSALNDLEMQVRGDLELAQRRMNMPVTAWRRSNDNSSFAPDIGQRDGNMEYVGGNPALPNSWRRAR